MSELPNDLRDLADLPDDFDPTAWIDENYPWLTEWLYFVPATHDTLPDRYDPSEYQGFRGCGRVQRNKKLLRAAVFSIEWTITAGSSEKYSMPGFVEQTGRLPTQDDVVWMVYLQHEIRVVEAAGRRTEYYEGLYRMHILHQAPPNQ